MASVELRWKTAPGQRALAESEAHVWCVELDQPASRVDELARLLSPEEQQRADRFQLAEKRSHFIVGRATLRRLLGEYSKRDPALLEFGYSPRGKPELKGPPVGKLHFNVSHSRNLALIALTRIGPLGVDLECVRPMRYDTAIARRFFTPRESASLESLPEAERPAAFFNLWTRKEAWLKATGDGIAESLSCVEVSFQPGEPARVLDVANAPGEADRWSLTELFPANGFIGALAVRMENVRTCCWQFPG